MARKMRSLILAVLCSAMCFLSGCEDGESYDYGDNDPNYFVAMGDSITEGVGDCGTPWPERLSAMLGKTIANEGVSGEHAYEGADRVDGVLSAYKPGRLLILYGANDIMHSRDHDEIIEDLRTIIQAAKNNKTVPELATLIPMSGHDEIFATGVESLNEDVRALASEEGVRLVDLEAAFEATGDVDAYMQSDGVHPNSDGNQLIAETFL